MNTSKKMGFVLLGISAILFSTVSYLNQGSTGLLAVAALFALFASVACFLCSIKF